MPWSDPDKFQLSKYQTNAIYRVITSSELPVTNFQLTWRIDPGTPLLIRPRIFAIIRHSITMSLFGIKKLRKGTYYVRSQVGAGQTEQKIFRNAWNAINGRYYKWDQVLAEIQSWVSKVENLAKETEQYEGTPDLWEELNQGKNFFSSQDRKDAENTPFTDAEQASISAHIKQIKDYIKATHQLTSEQISHVEARLDQAEGASRRMGRKDWLVLFNGAIFSLILTDLITPQTAQHIILMTVHGLSHLFGIGGPPHLLAGG